MYHRIYAPNGEPFDVPRERADSLILQEGWTQNPQTAVPVEEELTENQAKPIRGRKSRDHRVQADADE